MQWLRRRRAQIKSAPPTPVGLGTRDYEKLEAIAALVNDRDQPNIHALLPAIRNVQAVHLNLKFFGYDLARRLADAVPLPSESKPRHVGLHCKASVQADLDSDWAAHWCRELGVPRIYHRKLWELAYVLQAVWEERHLHPGARGLGFGCGVEPLPSYFMAQGAAVTITDLPIGRANQQGWADTSQHATSLEQAFHAHLVDRESFDRLADLRYVDMNAIPADLDGYDFCWSVCAFEHLGSIERGLDFLENSLVTLRPGGFAVHTTEYNVNPDGPTIDNWPSVMFQRRHFEALAERLTARGHRIAPFDFDLGSGPMDRFVDLPPYQGDLPLALREWVGPEYHLKLATDGFVATCFGLKIWKAG